MWTLECQFVLSHDIIFILYILLVLTDFVIQCELLVLALPQSRLLKYIMSLTSLNNWISTTHLCMFFPIIAISMWYTRVIFTTFVNVLKLQILLLFFQAIDVEWDCCRWLTKVLHLKLKWGLLISINLHEWSPQTGHKQKKSSFQKSDDLSPNTKALWVTSLHVYKLSNCGVSLFNAILFLFAMWIKLVGLPF